ncbi:MAG: ATP-grasp domain-containing protein [Actinobacteria bacterium]|nr:ATP-grasp domain-containing protein [Actinomycetota bacterium]
MISYFPFIGYVGSDPIFRMMIGPALDLGVDFRQFSASTDVKTLREFARQCNILLHQEGVLSISTIRALEAEGFVFRPSSAALEYAKVRNEKASKKSGSSISVLVSRSPHNQCSVWTPTQLDLDRNFSVTPAPGLSLSSSARVQEMALAIADEMGLVGVMSVEMLVGDKEIVIGQMRVHPTLAGNWTLDGSRTSQYEQHLRAILDLPLGDPTMTSPHAVSATFHSGAKSNMFRPYLHLMARSPALKFHQYRAESDGSAPQGHVTAVGDDLVDLLQCVNHAIDYMSGAVDE